MEGGFPDAHAVALAGSTAAGCRQDLSVQALAARVMRPQPATCCRRLLTTHCSTSLA